jgi:hypothetical protein
MNKNDTVVIRKVGNGFIVEPWGPPHIAMAISEMLVFNEMGFASGVGESGSTPCLLKFIEGHFTEGKSVEEPK